MDDNSISKKTLRMMDEAGKNLKERKSGEPIDFDKYPELLEEEK